jgi:hypothetical protein
LKVFSGLLPEIAFCLQYEDLIAEENEEENEDLIAEADTHAKENASNDEHSNVHCCGIDEATKEKADRASHDADPPPSVLGHKRCSEGGDQGRKIKRRSEERQHLVVIFAVVCLFQVRLFPLIYIREEILQEVIHGCHSAFCHVILLRGVSLIFFASIFPLISLMSI